MNPSTTISISEARKKIFAIADDVASSSTHYTITAKGSPKLVIMSATEFESWAETLEVIKDFPDLKEDIKKVSQDVKIGQYKKYTDLKAILISKNYKSIKNKLNGLSNKALPKSRKRSGQNS